MWAGYIIYLENFKTRHLKKNNEKPLFSQYEAYQFNIFWQRKCGKLLEIKCNKW